MKITNIHAHILSSPLEIPFAFSQGWVGARSATLIEVITDTGLTGWGEAFCQGLETPQIAAAAIESCFAPMLIGLNPLSAEKHWFDMYNRSRDFGRKGAVMGAISGIDIALWDIAGQAYKQPVWQLLGGAHRRQVEPYATGFYRLQGQGEAERLAEEAQMHAQNGFRYMKVKLGFGVRDDICVMQAIQKAIDPAEITLMVDSNHAYGRSEALYLGQALADMQLRWYEEPVVPEDYEGYADLRRRLPMAIAGGENEHSLYGFNALFEGACVDIAQPDIGSCGGFTAARHITALAQAKGVEINPHVWGSAVAQAASLHLIAALPNTHHSLFTRQPILEYDQSSHPFRRELTHRPVQMQNGFVQINDAPGLGIEIRKDTLARYRIN
jgi:D-galactarolactone cycloisomerase